MANSYRRKKRKMSRYVELTGQQIPALLICSGQLSPVAPANSKPALFIRRGYGCSASCPHETRFHGQQIIGQAPRHRPLETTGTIFIMVNIAGVVRITTNSTKPARYQRTGHHMQWSGSGSTSNTSPITHCSGRNVPTFARLARVVVP